MSLSTGHTLTLQQKKTKMRNLILVLLTLHTTFIFAQDFELIGFKYTNFPKSNVLNVEQQQEVAFAEFQAFIAIPKKLKNGKTTLVNRLAYNLVNTAVYNAPAFGEGKFDKNLHGISYAITAVHKWDDKWATIVQFQPTLASDFQSKLTIDDFVIQSVFLINRKMSDHFTLGAGAVYTTQSGEPFLWPAIQLAFNKDRHQLSALLPMKFKYLYWMGANKKMGAGLNAGFSGGLFDITLKSFGAAPPESINKIIYSRFNVAPQIVYHLTPKILLELSAGYTLRRKYQFRSIDDVLYNYTSENGPFFNVGLVYVPKKPSEE